MILSSSFLPCSHYSFSPHPIPALLQRSPSLSLINLSSCPYSPLLVNFHFQAAPFSQLYLSSPFFPLHHSLSFPHHFPPLISFLFSPLHSPLPPKALLTPYPLYPPNRHIPLNQSLIPLHSQVAEISKSKAIIAFTTAGSTALRVSKLRPTVPIIAVTYSMETARWLAMVSAHLVLVI